MEVEKTIFTPHPAQWQALNFSTQFGAAICGSQSGKTTIGAIWTGLRLQEEIQRDKPRPGLIAAPTVKILNQSTMQKFFEQFPNLRQYFKKQESVIEIPYTKPTRSGRPKKEVFQIFVRSFDRPLGVEGMSPGFAWLDEFGQCDQMAWVVVKTRMTVTQGKIFITTTPYNTGFLYRDIYIPYQEKTDTRMSIFTWSAYELADFFDDEAKKIREDKTVGTQQSRNQESRELREKAKAIRQHLLSEKKSLSPEEFEKRYMGKFSRMTGLVYNLGEEHYIPRQKMRFDRVVGGIDWGYHHPAVGVYGLMEGRWHVIGEWGGTRNTTDEIIDAAKELQNEFNVSKWYADSSNPEKIAQANKGTGLYVVPVKKGQYKRDNGTKVRSIEYGISLIQGLIRGNQFRVFNDLPLHRNEFEAYHYSDKPAAGKEDLPDKEDGNDHFMDAMRYALQSEAPARKVPWLKDPWEMLAAKNRKKQVKSYQFV